MVGFMVVFRVLAMSQLIPQFTFNYLSFSDLHHEVMGRSPEVLADRFFVICDKGNPHIYLLRNGLNDVLF